MLKRPGLIRLHFVRDEVLVPSSRWSASRSPLFRGRLYENAPAVPHSDAQVMPFQQGHSYEWRVHHPFYHSALRRDPPPKLYRVRYPTRSNRTLRA